MRGRGSTRDGESLSGLPASIGLGAWLSCGARASLRWWEEAGWVVKVVKWVVEATG